MSTSQFWLNRTENTLDSHLKTKLKTSRDMNVRQYPFDFFLGLQYLCETLEGKVDIDPDVRQKTVNVGGCCMLTFFEKGLSTSESFFDDDLAQNLEYNYSVNEFFYLTHDILLLKERDAKKQRADRRKAERKARKAKGEAKAST